MPTLTCNGEQIKEGAWPTLKKIGRVAASVRYCPADYKKGLLWVVSGDCKQSEAQFCYQVNSRINSTPDFMDD